MAKTSIFQKFVRSFWKVAKLRYPYFTRFEVPFCVAIPKSSSFIVGRSSRFDKYVVVDFQSNPKPWKVGQFTINAHISKELVPLNSFNSDDWSNDFLEGRDGYYRLAVASGSNDRWWCLAQDKHDSWLADSLGAEVAKVLTGSGPTLADNNWHPSSYDDEEQVIHEALEDVCRFLEKNLLEPYGFEFAQAAAETCDNVPGSCRPGQSSSMPSTL